MLRLSLSTLCVAAAALALAAPAVASPNGELGVYSTQAGIPPRQGSPGIGHMPSGAVATPYTGVETQDLRSPDAGDAARGVPPSAVVKVPVRAVPVTVATTHRGFDWPSAAVGAAFLGLVLLCAGAAALLRRGRAHVAHS